MSDTVLTRSETVPNIDISSLKKQQPRNQSQNIARSKGRNRTGSQGNITDTVFYKLGQKNSNSEANLNFEILPQGITKNEKNQVKYSATANGTIVKIQLKPAES